LKSAAIDAAIAMEKKRDFDKGGSRNGPCGRVLACLFAASAPSGARADDEIQVYTRRGLSKSANGRRKQSFELCHPGTQKLPTFPGGLGPEFARPMERGESALRA